MPGSVSTTKSGNQSRMPLNNSVQILLRIQLDCVDQRRLYAPTTRYDAYFIKFLLKKSIFWVTKNTLKWYSYSDRDMSIAVQNLISAHVDKQSRGTISVIWNMRDNIKFIQVCLSSFFWNHKLILFILIMVESYE